MPSGTSARFTPAWCPPIPRMPSRPHPRRCAHLREILLRLGQTAFRYRARGPRRPDYQRRCATGYRQNSRTPSRPFVWIALFLTSSFRRQSLGASVTLSATNRLGERRYLLIAALKFLSTPSCPKRIGTAT